MHPGSIRMSDEPYGATDINAITGNGGLSVGINEEGTITVFKWPSPSFYDHVKYMTDSREDEDLGALPDEGVFTGIRYEIDGQEHFTWLPEIVALVA